MKNNFIFLCLLSISLIYPGLCISGERPDHVCFRRIDTNHDGNVTFKEFAVYYGKDKAKFKKADADGNGLLTHDEYHDFLGHGAAAKDEKK